MRSRSLMFTETNRRKISKRQKRASRRLLASTNTRVFPGTFEDVDLSTARARRTAGNVVELRAQCHMRTRVRTVAIMPLVQPGDLFWVRAGRAGSRAASRLTLVVEEVRCCRVRDMNDEDARAEGVANVQAFAELWDEIHGAGAWDRNDWVIAYGFKTRRGNIDRLYPVLRGNRRVAA